MKRRNTASKDAVWSILTSSGKAMSQDAIERQLDVAADRATIYRILSRFCEDGLVHKLIGDDGKQYFAACVKCDHKKKSLPENHFHFRCTTCNTVSCLPSIVTFSVPRGYHVDKLNCVLVGTCKDCN